MAHKEFPLAGKTALITGGAKRLGRACALALARQGVNIVIHYRASEEDARNTAEQIRFLGASAWIVPGDQSNPKEAARLFELAADAAGPLDFLVNSASVFPSSTLRDFTIEQLIDTLRTNAYGPLVLARAFAAQKREGAIANFLDSRITDYDKAHAAYHLSKRMFFTLTRMMALEFAPAITVNAVAPGLVLPPVGKEESYLEELAHTNPLRRYGGEDDIADAVVFLLRSRFITGQVLYVDGGRHMYGNTYGA